MNIYLKDGRELVSRRGEYSRGGNRMAVTAGMRMVIIARLLCAQRWHV